MNMEFIYSTYFNTTTLCTVNNGTNTVLYMFDQDSNTDFESSGDNSDATTTTIRIDFPDTQTVDRIILRDINFKSFKIYYNSNSANLFSMTGSVTGTSFWTGNSETSLYLICATVTNISSIFIEATATMIADEEKACGEFYISRKYFTMEYNPNAENYNPKFYGKQFSHEMSDGGNIVYYIAKKFQAEIELKYISETEHNNFLDLYNENINFLFSPFPTGTNWDNKIYNVNWVGDFNFEKFSDNVKNNGYSGKILLYEVPQ